jgi:hypothetical protein
MKTIFYQWMLLLASCPFLSSVSTSGVENVSSEWICRVVRNNVLKERGENNIFLSSNVGVDDSEDEDGDWECIVSEFHNGIISSGHSAYVLQNLPADFVTRNFQMLAMGNLVIRLNATLDGDTRILQVAQSDEEIVVVQEESQRRLDQKLVAAIGRRRVLALSLSTSDSRPRFNASTLYPFLFSGELPSMMKQFESCSAGQLQFEPIFGGTMDIALPKSMRHYQNKALVAVDEALDFVTNLLGEDIIPMVDHVLFCFPPGILSVTAAAVTNHFRSVYNDVSCARLSVVMHELG